MLVPVLLLAAEAFAPRPSFSTTTLSRAASPLRMMAAPADIEGELSALQLQIEASKIKTQLAELRLEELKEKAEILKAETAAALKDLQEANNELGSAVPSAVPVPEPTLVDAAEAERQALIAKIAELEAPTAVAAMPEAAITSDAAAAADTVAEAAAAAAPAPVAAAFDFIDAAAVQEAAAESSAQAVQETAAALQEAAASAGPDATPLLLAASVALIVSLEALKLINTPRTGSDDTAALPSLTSLSANAAKMSKVGEVAPQERSALDIFYGGLANLEKDNFTDGKWFYGPSSPLYSLSDDVAATAGATAAVAGATAVQAAATATAPKGGRPPRMGAKELAKEAARRAAAAAAEQAAEEEEENPFARL